MPRNFRVVSGAVSGAISDELFWHSPGNCRAVSEQLTGNISRNTGKCPRSSWRNVLAIAGEVREASSESPTRFLMRRSRNGYATPAKQTTQQPRTVLKQSLSTVSPRTQPGRGQEKDAAFPRPQTIRRRVWSTSALNDRPHCHPLLSRCGHCCRSTREL